MKIVPKYWVYIDKRDGNGFAKVRRNDDGHGWSYGHTYLQLRAARREAKKNGWLIKSQTIPVKKSKPPKALKKSYPNETHVTPNFRWSEFACKDGTPVPKEYRSRIVKLAWGLEKMRDILDAPVGVLSGYRTESYNRKIGGASQSQHVQARAADLVVAPHGQDRLVRAAEQVDVFRNGGIGVYPNGGVHVDVRGYKARWSSF